MEWRRWWSFRRNTTAIAKAGRASPGRCGCRRRSRCGSASAVPAAGVGAAGSGRVGRFRCGRRRCWSPRCRAAAGPASCFSECARSSTPSMSTITWPSAAGLLAPANSQTRSRASERTPRIAARAFGPDAASASTRREMVGSEATGPTRRQPTHLLRDQHQRRPARRPRTASPQAGPLRGPHPGAPAPPACATCPCTTRHRTGSGLRSSPSHSTSSPGCRCSH